MGSRLNRPSEAVLMCTHNLCFEQKYEYGKKKKSTENCHFYSRKISLYVAWACLSNVYIRRMCLSVNSGRHEKIFCYLKGKLCRVPMGENYLTVLGCYEPRGNCKSTKMLKLTGLSMQSNRK